MTIENAQFEGTSTYNAYGNSRMAIINTNLDRSQSWLVTNMQHEAELYVNNSYFIPSEIYIRNSSTVNIFDGSETGVWLELHDGIVGTMELPEQIDASGFPTEFTWLQGRDQTDLTGVDWQLNISNARVVLGIESRQGSEVTIIGNANNTSPHGELTVSYIVENGDVQYLDNLQAGHQTHTVLGGTETNPRLTLDNVNLGLIPWQIYAQTGGEVHITNSVLNEVGAGQAGLLTVDQSLLQLAVVGAIGTDSRIEISNSDIHCKQVSAKADASIYITDSRIHGSPLTTDTEEGSLSNITIEQSELLTNDPPEVPPFQVENPDCSTTLGLEGFLLSDGTVGCNPFVPVNAEVTRDPEDSSRISCASSTNCVW